MLHFHSYLRVQCIFLNCNIPLGLEFIGIYLHTLKILKLKRPHDRWRPYLLVQTNRFKTEACVYNQLKNQLFYNEYSLIFYAIHTLYTVETINVRVPKENDRRHSTNVEIVNDSHVWIRANICVCRRTLAYFFLCNFIQ